MWFILSEYGRALIILCVKFRIKSKSCFDELDIIRYVERHLSLGFSCILRLFLKLKCKFMWSKCCNMPYEKWEQTVKSRNSFIYIILSLLLFSNIFPSPIFPPILKGPSEIFTGIGLGTVLEPWIARSE